MQCVFQGYFFNSFYSSPLLPNMWQIVLGYMIPAVMCISGRDVLVFFSKTFSAKWTQTTSTRNRTLFSDSSFNVLNRFINSIFIYWSLLFITILYKFFTDIYECNLSKNVYIFFNMSLCRIDIHRNECTCRHIRLNFNNSVS